VNNVIAGFAWPSCAVVAGTGTRAAISTDAEWCRSGCHVNTGTSACFAAALSRLPITEYGTGHPSWWKTQSRSDGRTHWGPTVRHPAHGHPLLTSRSRQYGFGRLTS
jgi:hypothetical protein